MGRAACTGCIVLSGSFLLLRPAMIGSFSASCLRCSEETARHSLFLGMPSFFVVFSCAGCAPFEWLVAQALRLLDSRPFQLHVLQLEHGGLLMDSARCRALWPASAC